MDIVDSATRSRMMAGIKGKNTRPELTVRRYLHGQGFRFRLHSRHLPGKPDVVLPKYKLAIYIHGCFWHRHQGCKFATNPKVNAEKWQLKFSQNLTRDRNQIEALMGLGWRVLVIWECGVKLGSMHLSWLSDYIKHSHDLPFQEWPN